MASMAGSAPGLEPVVGLVQSLGDVERGPVGVEVEEGDAGEFDPIVRDVVIENLRIENAGRVFQVRGFERDPIRDMTLRDVHVRHAGKIGIVENVTNFHTENVTINGERYEYR